MKHKLKKILLLYIISGTLFVSCSLEEEYLKQDNSNLKIKIERKTFHELMKEEKFNAAYAIISKQKNPISSSVLGRTVMEAEYDFTISNIPAKVITYGNNISYSFHINRNASNSNYFENLVVKVDSTTIPKAYIIKYVLKSNPIFISEHNAYTLDAQTEITQINYNDTEAKIEYYDGCAVVTLWCPYDGPHPATEKCIKQDRGDLYWVRDTSGCVDDLDSGGGGSSSNPIDMTGGGGGTGGGGTTGEVETPPNDSGNNNPIVTAPVLELEEENEENEGNDPCIDLKNKFKPQNENIKPIIDSLKQFINEPDERSVSFKRYIGIDGAPDEYIPYWETGTANTAPVSFGGFWYGSIHTHPFGYDTMFSWQDVSNLLKLYEDTRITNKKIVFNMIVCSNNEVYCIKIDNFLQLKLELKNDWDIPELADCDDALKDAYLVEMMQKVYSKDTNSERAFLKRFANYGISLYKANSNLTNWSKLTVNTPITNSSIVNENPCN